MYSGLWMCLEEEPSTELLRLSHQGSSILGPSGDAVQSGDLRVARRDVASLPAGQRGIPRTVAVRRVVNHHHRRIHSGQRVHAALTHRVEPRGAQL